jgi:hypothetical protein
LYPVSKGLVEMARWLGGWIFGMVEELFHYLAGAGQIEVVVMLATDGKRESG